MQPPTQRQPKINKTKRLPLKNRLLQHTINNPKHHNPLQRPTHTRSQKHNQRPRHKPTTTRNTITAHKKNVNHPTPSQ